MSCLMMNSKIGAQDDSTSLVVNSSASNTLLRPSARLPPSPPPLLVDTPQLNVGPDERSFKTSGAAGTSAPESLSNRRCSRDYERLGKDVLRRWGQGVARETSGESRTSEEEAHLSCSIACSCGPVVSLEVACVRAASRSIKPLHRLFKTTKVSRVAAAERFSAACYGPYIPIRYPKQFNMN
ncbi:hypothetical protein EYF80_022171 [Liparis tanakae]|uniref:Uncharacterized protein n=1 Tax=Liparis tanakae TaxID=230148 RepID=A0A4Z2HS20_9TELE|nr:hypothetical protein EYF80_022171 [Liparis tanakae]